MKMKILRSVHECVEAYGVCTQATAQSRNVCSVRGIVFVIVAGSTDMLVKEDQE